MKENITFNRIEDLLLLLGKVISVNNIKTLYFVSDISFRQDEYTLKYAIVYLSHIYIYQRKGKSSANYIIDPTARNKRILTTNKTIKKDFKKIIIHDISICKDIFKKGENDND